MPVVVEKVVIVERELCRCIGEEPESRERGALGKAQECDRGGEEE